MINVSELVTDPDFCQPNGINIIRSEITGYEDFAPVTSEKSLNIPGVILIDKDLADEMLPEYDRSTESIITVTHELLHTTGKKSEDDTQEYIADIIVWQGVKYKVMRCRDNAQYGYCLSAAVKMRKDVM
jgi:hypothetical protein|nr:MAG TPA: peptidase [Caudoviricetes sp.]